MNQYISQNQFNEYGSKGIKKTLQQAGLIAYDAGKALIDFITSMVMMFLGKY